MNHPTPYTYVDDGYRYLSVHRKVVAYDPRNTDNLLIMDYFNTRRKYKDDSTLYYKLVDTEFEKHKSAEPTPLPISMSMINHEINMAWVEIIHQMLFVDNVYDSFYGEYRDLLEDIIIHDTLDDKETLVFRTFFNGETPFHLAGKMWLYEKYATYKKGGINSNLDKDLAYILICYESLETRFGKDRKFCILYMVDFSGKTLIDYLTDFVEELQNKLA